MVKMIPLRSLSLMLALAFSAGPLRAEDRLQVIADDAFCGADGCRFSGRLVEVHASPDADDGRWSTLWKNSRILLADGETGEVVWRVGNSSWEAHTDERGYWALTVNPSPVLPPGWHEIVSEPGRSSPAGLLVVDQANRFGIISDIDDTILVSEVTDKSALLRNSLTLPPERREAVPGMAALYRRWLARNPAPDSAAMFYVSATPRQLTDNLRVFLADQGFPRGVLRLREFPEPKADKASPESVESGYKMRTIEALLMAYPEVRFALFGDDGERDPEIYAALREKFPGQVEAIWIRRVSPVADRPRLPDEGDIAELLAQP